MVRTAVGPIEPGASCPAARPAARKQFKEVVSRLYEAAWAPAACAGNADPRRGRTHLSSLVQGFCDYDSLTLAIGYEA